MSTILVLLFTAFLVTARIYYLTMFKTFQSKCKFSNHEFFEGQLSFGPNLGTVLFEGAIETFLNTKNGSNYKWICPGILQKLT